MKHIHVTSALLATLLWQVAPAPAALVDLLPNLASEDMKIRTQAMNDLMTEASHASRPDAEDERVAYAESLCVALSTNTPAPTAAAILRQLQRIGGDESVKTLATWLGHPAETLRDDARQALEAIPSPRAGRALLSGLDHSKDATFTAGILDSLGARGESDAIPAIASRIESEHPAVTTAALRALARIPEPASAKALFKARARAEGPSRAALTSALIDLAGVLRAQGHDAAVKDIYHTLFAREEPETVRAVALTGIILTDPDNTVGGANYAFHGPDAYLHAAVAEAAAQLRSAPLNQAIAAQLIEVPPEYQVPLLGALEFSGDSSLAAHITPLLSSTNAGVAGAAALALERIGTMDSVPALLAAAGTVPEAARALGRLDVAGAGDAVREAAAQGTPESRARAIRILGERADDGVVPLLLGYAREENSAISTAAFDALKNTVQKSDLEGVVALMLDVEDPQMGKRALGTMVPLIQKSGDPAHAVGLLSARLADASPDAQNLIFQALMRAGSDAALVPVKEAALAQGGGETAAAAFKVLTSWPEPNAIPVLLDVVKQDLELEQQVTAMRGLTRLLGKEKKVNLTHCGEALAAARRPEELKLVLATIAKSSDDKALELLTPYLDNAEVQAEAQAAADAISARKGR